jgi:hypothetical protein|tara:strand:+ start:129 stop:617 length:489 start_codon:yes stop_codon:yes gene_type:complete
MFRKLIFTIILGFLVLNSFMTSAFAEALVHGFKNPSFSGTGYSQHVLSIDQLQETRKKQVRDDKKSADAAKKREENNTTINKFIKNVESRIYANLSKQLVDNMFGTTCDSNTTTCPTSGTATVEGSTIYWVKDTSTEVITLTITDPTGNVTTMSVPLGDFQF